MDEEKQDRHLHRQARTKRSIERVIDRGHRSQSQSQSQREVLRIHFHPLVSDPSEWKRVVERETNHRRRHRHRLLRSSWPRKRQQRRN